jgi:XTP/dITP diphosphohydrolase
VILESEAKCFGNIILSPRGNSGFGYDPIFEELSSKLTFAEMNNVIKDSCSHRGKALKKIIPDLLEIFS